MKKLNSILLFSLLAFISITVDSCKIIGDIFKAGVWVGILLVVLVVGIIFWLINKAKK